MQHILPTLMRYRYLILASLSLLWISEMVVADIDSVPVEYEWIFGCLVALTVAAWTGILCVIGYGPPIDRAVPKRTSNIYVPNFSVDALEEEPKRRGHTILVLSPALFVMFALLSILGAILFQAQFLLDLIRWPYWLVFFMVWIGMVMIVGATVNVDSSKKTYLVVNVFPILVLGLTILFVPAALLLGGSNGVIQLFGLLVVFLATFLVIGVVVRRAMLSDNSWIGVAIISFGISVVSFIPVMLNLLYVASAAAELDTCNDCPGLAVGIFTGIFIVTPILLSLTISVPLTILIGTMRRPIRNIAVVGIGIVPMIVLFVVYWFSIW